MSKVKFISNFTNQGHHNSLEMLVEFLGNDGIEYQDLGNGENYYLVKDGKKIRLDVRGNRFDGGYMNVHKEIL